MNILEKKETKIAAIAVSIILLFVIVILLFNQGNLKQTKTSLQHEAGKEFSFNVHDFFDVDEETAKKITYDASQVNPDKAGEYELTVSYGNKIYTVLVNVVDTTTPKVEFVCRYVFTNNVGGVNVSSMIKNVSDTSEYTAKLIRFEKKDVLGHMDELALRKLTEGAERFPNKEAALAVGSEEIPTKPGIYRSVLEIGDASGNAAYEEVFVILDTRAALINEASDVVVKVPADKLSEKPVIDESIYKGHDEVDGLLSGADFNYSLTLMDEAKHEWKLTISYTDRAGNESEVYYKVTVTEESQQVADNDKGNNNAGNGENADNGNSGNVTTTPGTNPTPETPSTTPSTPSEPEPSTPSTPSDPEPSTPSAPEQDDTEYDPRDENRDGFVSESEEMRYITPEKQKCIDAGYGVVVEQDGGEWYAILMKDCDHKINGKHGGEILSDYLKEHNLHADLLVGCYINSDNEWYWYIADGITEIPENSGSGDIDWDDVNNNLEFND